MAVQALVELEEVLVEQGAPDRLPQLILGQERRKPQDGRFSAQVSGKEYDFRISTLPILHGESIVLRILDKSKVLISLENLGMHPNTFDKFNKAMKAPYGH